VFGIVDGTTKQFTNGDPAGFVFVVEFKGNGGTVSVVGYEAMFLKGIVIAVGYYKVDGLMNFVKASEVLVKGFSDAIFGVVAC
jgi:hypothetical protein